MFSVAVRLNIPIYSCKSNIEEREKRTRCTVLDFVSGSRGTENSFVVLDAFKLTPNSKVALR